MIGSSVLRGGCHCGHVRLEFATDMAPADFSPRACDCAFCTKHGASYISDPRGSLSIQVQGLDTINEYRQGSGSARFLVCRRCGVLVAAMFDGAAGSFGAINARCIEGDVAFGAPQTVSPQRLDGEEKRQRWQRLWTPHVALTVSPE